MITKMQIFDLIEGISRNSYGDAYVDAMRDLPDEERFIKCQTNYIIGNLEPKTASQRERIKKLMVLLGHKQDVIDETELETIMNLFERFTEDKVQDMPKLQDIWDIEEGYDEEDLTDAQRKKKVAELEAQREANKVTLSDFERFAEEYGYALDVVMKANPWVEDVVTKEAWDAIEKVIG